MNNEEKKFMLGIKYIAIVISSDLTEEYKQKRLAEIQQKMDKLQEQIEAKEKKKEGKKMKCKIEFRNEMGDILYATNEPTKALIFEIIMNGFECTVESASEKTDFGWSAMLNDSNNTNIYALADFLSETTEEDMIKYREYGVSELLDDFYNTQY